MKYLSIKKINLKKPGITLIEASAGTGKTLSIILLYMKLLFNINNEKKKYTNANINNITILTFTEFSKNELIVRMEKILTILIQEYYKKNTNIDYLKEILKSIQKDEKKYKILKHTQKNKKNIQIYTIHGFFWNILQEYQFFFTKEIPLKIITNIKKIYFKSIINFWRKHIYNIDKNILKIILQKFKTPYDLYKKIYNWMLIPYLSYEKKIRNEKIFIQKYYNSINVIKNIKKIWKNQKKNIILDICNTPLNKRVYSIKKIKIWCEKIDQWSNEKTINFEYPNILKYFSKETITLNLLKKKKINNIFFNKIKKILDLSSNFMKNFINFSLIIIQKNIEKEKNIINGLEFHDIIKIIWKEIKLKENYVKKLILKKNIAIFIDECQDMDNLQYQIFENLYQNNNNKSLFLIGDPKQAIYSFRGSNIFSYLNLKKKIKECYYLPINFRSSRDVVQGINFLFNRVKNPFLFKNIKFQPSKIYKENINKYLVINNKKKAAIQFVFYSKNCINVQKYYTWIADKCATSVSTWLNKKTKTNYIYKENKEFKKIDYQDIAILVKNKYEAEIIKNALKKLGIKSNYSSKNNNIFQESETKEILWILDAIANPTDSYKFQKILITKIIKKNIFEIYQINKRKTEFSGVIKILKKYFYIWNNLGIFRLIEEIILDCQINYSTEMLLTNKINTYNMLILANILDKQEEKIKNKFLLINWLQEKIIKQEYFPFNVLDQTEIVNPILHDKNYINIITIHKSKGLEYSLVWIPFFSNFDISQNKILYKTNSQKQYKNEKNNTKFKKFTKKVKLSEDLRLLYVALTRTILHCSIGLASIKKKNEKQKNYTNLHLNALGYLIQKGKKKTFLEFKKILQEIQIQNIIKISTSEKKKIFLLEKKEYTQNINPITITRKIQYPWMKINYSKLYNFIKKFKQDNDYYYKNYKNLFNFTPNHHKIEIYKFPMGKKSGIFLHYILKNIEFSKKNNIEKIINNYHDFSISKKWKTIIVQWIKNFLVKKINIDFSLKKLKKKDYIKELKFLLPINKYLDFIELDKIMKKFDINSKNAPILSYKKITGILNGTIDLIFFWKNKYFIIDYKTNFLGFKNKDYSAENIKNEIIKQRYDLQYQIYCLALHRYLTVYLKSYKYSNHFGGVFYLFLRAFDNKSNNHGIFFNKPSFILIDSLDKLLKGNISDKK